MQAMWRSLKPVSTFFRRARFFSKLVLTGKARYACYLMEMRLRGVDLGWQSTHDLGLAKERAHDHADSGGPELASLLRQIRLRPGCTILDLGCGKGGAMITFARSGFKRVDGIELSPELCRVARRNLGLLGLSDVHVIECACSVSRSRFSSTGMESFVRAFKAKPICMRLNPASKLFWHPPSSNM